MAGMKVVITDGGLKAKLTIQESKTSHPDEKEIRNFLNENGIKYGFISQLIREIARKPVFNTPVTVAEGKKAKDGIDGFLDFLVNINFKNFYIIPGHKEKELYDFIIIRENTVVAKIIPPITGDEGMTVEGEKIAPYVPKEIKLIMGANIENENGYLKAKRTGKLFFRIDDKNTHYIDIEEVTSLDEAIKSDFYSEENIEINSYISENIIICSGKDIKVKGKISNATLIAKRNIIIDSIENAKIECHNNIIVESHISDSIVNCDGSIYIRDPKTAIISGGEIIVGKNLITNVIGTPQKKETIIKVGILPEIYKKIDELDSQLEQDKDKLNKLSVYIQANLEDFKANRMTEMMKNEYIQKFNYTKTLVAVIKEDTSILETLKTQIETYINQGFILARKEINPGTIIKFNFQNMRVEQLMQNVKILMKDNKIISQRN